MTPDTTHIEPELDTDADGDRDRHDIELRDVRDGRLVVSYVTIVRESTITAVRDVSTRLPVECLALFRDGTLDIDALTTEEKRWIAATAEPNAIDFEGVTV